MGNKVGTIFLVWLGVVVAYIMMAAVFPAMTGISEDASTQLSSSSNMTLYPGSLDVVDGFPLWVWLIPGGLGIVATVVNLKANKEQS